MSPRVLLSIFFLLFALGSVVLFWQNDKEHDPAYQKDWWLIAFQEPQVPESLNFRIENYSQTEDFSYRILQDTTVIQEASLSLSPGETKEIEVAPRAAAITVEVLHGDEKKSIYRK